MSGEKDRRRNIAARNAAPVRGTYICGHDGSCDNPGPGWGASADAHCWTESTARRLAWQGGPSANAEADLAAWNSLGSRKRDAA